MRCPEGPGRSSVFQRPPRASMCSLLPPRTEEQQGMRASAGPCWFKRVPCASLAVLIASGAYFALFYHVPLSSPDEGLIASAAERILRGQVPYRDFFSELGPGSFYLQAAIFKLAGINISVLRLTAWFLGVALSGLIFYLSRQLMGTLAAFLPPLVFVTICYPHYDQISHHWWGNFFFLLMVLCLSGRAKGARGNNPTWSKPPLFLAGMLSAATALCMQSKGAWAVLIGLIWLVVMERWPDGQTWRGAIRRSAAQGFYFLLGVGIATGLMAGYFGARGGLWGWVQDNLVFLLTNYRPYESVPNAYSWARLTRLISWLLRDHSEWALSYVVDFYFFALVGPAIAFAGAAWQLLRPERVEFPRSHLLSLYLLGGLGSLFSELHASNTYHFVSASPLMLILLVHSCLWAYRRWGWLRGPLWAAAGVTLIFAVFGARLAFTHFVSSQVPVSCRRGTVYRAADTAAEFQQWITAIENAVPAGEETFFFPYDASLYFLTGTQNPTRYDVLLAGFHSPQQVEEAIRTLRWRRPRYIFSFDQIERYTVRTHLPDDEPDLLAMHPVEQFLRGPDSLYRLEREVEGLEVWTLKK